MGRGRQSTDKDRRSRAGEKLKTLPIPKSLWRAGESSTHRVGYQVDEHTQNANGNQSSWRGAWGKHGGVVPGWNLEVKEGCTGLKAEEAAYAKVWCSRLCGAGKGRWSWGQEQRMHRWEWHDMRPSSGADAGSPVVNNKWNIFRDLVFSLANLSLS